MQSMTNLVKSRAITLVTSTYSEQKSTKTNILSDKFCIITMKSISCNNNMKFGNFSKSEAGTLANSVKAKNSPNVHKLAKHLKKTLKFY